MNDEGCRGGARDSKLAMESKTWRHNDGGCVGRRKVFKGRALCKEEDDGRRGTGSYSKGAMGVGRRGGKWAAGVMVLAQQRLTQQAKESGPLTADGGLRLSGAEVFC